MGRGKLPLFRCELLSCFDYISFNPMEQSRIPLLVCQFRDARTIAGDMETSLADADWAAQAILRRRRQEEK